MHVYLSQFVVHVTHFPLCVNLQQQFFMADQCACWNTNKTKLKVVYAHTQIKHL